MPPTISQVLANKDQYPQELADAAKNLYETKLLYAGKAAEQARQLVLNAEVLTVDAGEQKAAFAQIVDIRQSVVDKADAAFAIVAADYPEPKAPPEPKPTPTPPAGSEPAAATGGSLLAQG